MVDYGQGLYGDQPKVRRNEPEHKIDYYEKLSEDLVARFRQDLDWLNEQQKLQKRNPEEEVQQLKDLMSQQKSVSQQVNKMIRTNKQTALDSHFAKFEK